MPQSIIIHFNRSQKNPLRSNMDKCSRWNQQHSVFLGLIPRDVILKYIYNFWTNQKYRFPFFYNIYWYNQFLTILELWYCRIDMKEKHTTKDCSSHSLYFFKTEKDSRKRWKLQHELTFYTQTVADSVI